jgi:hypothetical protein
MLKGEKLVVGYVYSAASVADENSLKGLIEVKRAHLWAPRIITQASPELHGQSFLESWLTVQARS